MTCMNDLYEEYNRHFARSKGMIRRFQQIDIAEPPPDLSGLNSQNMLHYLHLTLATVPWKCINIHF